MGVILTGITFSAKISRNETYPDLIHPDRIIIFILL